MFRRHASHSRTKDLSDLESALGDAEWWADRRGEILSILTPPIRALFMVGSGLAQRVQPVPELSLAPLLKSSSLAAKDDSTSTDRGGGLDLAAWATLFADNPVFTVDLDAILRAADLFVSSYTDDWWARWSTGTQNRLRAIVDTARRDGLDTAAVLKLAVDNFDPAYAGRIAVSEVTNILGGAAQVTYQVAGFSGWEWMTVMDSFVDPECTALAGRIFPMSILFQRKHFGCRCLPRPAGEPSSGIGAFAAVPRGNPAGQFTAG